MCKSVQRLIHFNFVPTIKFKRLVRWPLAKIQLRIANNWLATRQVFFFSREKDREKCGETAKTGEFEFRSNLFFKFSNSQNQTTLKSQSKLEALHKENLRKTRKALRTCLCVCITIGPHRSSEPDFNELFN